MEQLHLHGAIDRVDRDGGGPVLWWGRLQASPAGVSPRNKFEEEAKLQGLPELS